MPLDCPTYSLAYLLIGLPTILVATLSYPYLTCQIVGAPSPIIVEAPKRDYCRDEPLPTILVAMRADEPI